MSSKINNVVDYYAEQANQGWLDVGRKFLWTAEKLSFNEEGKEWVKQHYDNIVATQLEKQQKLDEYAQSKGMMGSTALNLSGGVLRNSSDPTEVLLNYVTQGALANVVGNAASYAWEQASLYGRNIITEWDNEQDIMGLAPGAIMGVVAGKLGDKYKVDNAPLYEEVKTKGKVENVAPLEKQEPKAPLDAAMEDIKSMNPEAKDNLIKEGHSIINFKHTADIVKRQEWDITQANYKDTTADDWHNYLNYATKLDGEYKAEKFGNTVFENGEVVKKGTSGIKVEHELDVAVQPLLKNARKHLEQIAGEDAAELFGDNPKPFGNQLWDLSNDLDPKTFAEMVQGKIEVLDEAGSNRMNAVIKRKVEEYIGVRSGADETPEIKYAHFTDLLYNKQDTMNYLHRLVLEEDFDNIRNLGESVGRKVDLTQEQVDAIVASMEKMGKISKITEAGTYSIDDYPLEMTTGFWHGVNSTTVDAQKNVGTYAGRNKWDVAQQWGNIADDLPNTDFDPAKVKFGSYAQVFEGFERKPYEVLTEVYSTVAEHKAGIDKIRSWIHDISADDKGFEFTFPEYGNKVKGLDSRVRSYMKEQLRGLDEVLETGSRYKPNLNLDPNDPRITTKHARKSFKNFLNWKFLYGLNYIKEAPMNAYKFNEGARSLGWETGNLRYLKDTFIEPVKMHYDLARHWNEIKNNDLSKITDPKVRRRMEIFIERRMANDTIWNDPSKWGTAQKTAHVAGQIGGFGQTLSDVVRVFISEWGTKNYMQDIFPNRAEISPRLKAVLESNGIGSELLEGIKNRLRNISEEEFNDLVWSGKRAGNEIDVKIQNLYEQFADVMGREFNPFEKVKNMAADSFSSDMMMLYKRYSMGALDSAWNKLTSYYGDDGRLRKRFDFNDSFTRNAKRTFKGFNQNELFVLGQRGVYGYLLTGGVQWATGKMYGTQQDFKVEAKLEAITEGGSVLPFVYEAMSDLAKDYTGAGILFGASTPFGGLIDSITDRSKRAGSALKLSPTEKVIWFLNATLMPEHIARGIDNIKLDKSIPSRLTTASERADMLWRVKYKNQARMQQIKGNLPIEEVLGQAVDWVAYFTQKPEKAYEITGTDPKTVDEQTAIIGASGIVEVLEDKAENEAIVEIMSSHDIPMETREADLKKLGLDMETQLGKLEPVDRRTLNAVLAFKQVRDPAEILLITQALVKSQNRKAFIRSLIPDEELDFYRAYAKQVAASKEEVNKLIKQREKKGIEGYIESLEIADKYIRQ